MIQARTLRDVLRHCLECLNQIDRHQDHGIQSHCADLLCYLDAAQTLSQTLRDDADVWVGEHISDSMDACQQLANELPGELSYMPLVVREIRKRLDDASSAIDIGWPHSINSQEDLRA